MFVSSFSLARIDFDDPSTTRTGNLAKSAVLAALEEEERERSGQKPGERADVIIRMKVLWQMLK